MKAAFDEEDDDRVIQAVIQLTRGIGAATEEPRKAATARKIEQMLRHARGQMEEAQKSQQMHPERKTTCKL